MGAGTEEPVPEMGAQKRGRAGVWGTMTTVGRDQSEPGLGRGTAHTLSHLAIGFLRSCAPPPCPSSQGHSSKPSCLSLSLRAQAWHTTWKGVAGTDQ